MSSINNPPKNLGIPHADKAENLETVSTANATVNMQSFQSENKNKKQINKKKQENKNKNIINQPAPVNQPQAKESPKTTEAYSKSKPPQPAKASYASKLKYPLDTSGVSIRFPDIPIKELKEMENLVKQLYENPSQETYVKMMKLAAVVDAYVEEPEKYVAFVLLPVNIHMDIKTTVLLGRSTQPDTAVENAMRSHDFDKVSHERSYGQWKLNLEFYTVSARNQIIGKKFKVGKDSYLIQQPLPSDGHYYWDITIDRYFDTMRFRRIMAHLQVPILAIQAPFATINGQGSPIYSRRVIFLDNKPPVSHFENRTLPNKLVLGGTTYVIKGPHYAKPLYHGTNITWDLDIIESMVDEPSCNDPAPSYDDDNTDDYDDKSDANNDKPDQNDDKPESDHSNQRTSHQNSVNQVLSPTSPDDLVHSTGNYSTAENWPQSPKAHLETNNDDLDQELVNQVSGNAKSPVLTPEAQYPDILAGHEEIRATLNGIVDTLVSNTPEHPADPPEVTGTRPVTASSKQSSRLFPPPGSFLQQHRSPTRSAFNNVTSHTDRAALTKVNSTSTVQSHPTSPPGPSKQPASSLVTRDRANRFLTEVDITPSPIRKKKSRVDSSNADQELNVAIHLDFSSVIDVPEVRPNSPTPMEGIEATTFDNMVRHSDTVQDMELSGLASTLLPMASKDIPAKKLIPQLSKALQRAKQHDQAQHTEQESPHQSSEHQAAAVVQEWQTVKGPTHISHRMKHNMLQQAIIQLPVSTTNPYQILADDLHDLEPNMNTISITPKLVATQLDSQSTTHTITAVVQDLWDEDVRQAGDWSTITHTVVNQTHEGGNVVSKVLRSQARKVSKTGLAQTLSRSVHTKSRTPSSADDATPRSRITKVIQSLTNRKSIDSCVQSLAHDPVVNYGIRQNILNIPQYIQEVARLHSINRMLMKHQAPLSLHSIDRFGSMLSHNANYPEFINTSIKLRSALRHENSTASEIQYLDDCEALALFEVLLYCVAPCIITNTRLLQATIHAIPLRLPATNISTFFWDNATLFQLLRSSWGFAVTNHFSDFLASHAMGTHLISLMGQPVLPNPTQPFPTSFMEGCL